MTIQFRASGHAAFRSFVKGRLGAKHTAAKPSSQQTRGSQDQADIKAKTETAGQQRSQEARLGRGRKLGHAKQARAMAEQLGERPQASLDAHSKLEGASVNKALTTEAASETPQSELRAGDRGQRLGRGIGNLLSRLAKFLDRFRHDRGQTDGENTAPPANEGSEAVNPDTVNPGTVHETGSTGSGISQGVSQASQELIDRLQLSIEPKQRDEVALAIEEEVTSPREELDLGAIVRQVLSEKLGGLLSASTLEEVATSITDTVEGLVGQQRKAGPLPKPSTFSLSERLSASFENPHAKQGADA